MNMALNTVGIWVNHKMRYPTCHSYNPSSLYPEYPFDHQQVTSDSQNDIYCTIRRIFKNLKLDIDRYGSSSWNPLGEFIKEDDIIVIKPNFVDHKHYGNDNLYSVITHPSIIRCICDYLFIALDGTGKIIIADSPEQYTDFDELIANIRLHEIVELYRDECSSISVGTHMIKISECSMSE